MRISKDRRRVMVGMFRWVFLAEKWAFKVPRNWVGLRCNREENRHWRNVPDENRAMLCPVVFHLPFGLLTVMLRAEPLSEQDAEMANGLDMPEHFPFWHPIASYKAPVFEHNASNWGYVNGRPVVIDYGGAPSG